jgi:hypothetical protein
MRFDEQLNFFLIQTNYSTNILDTKNLHMTRPLQSILDGQVNILTH